MSKNLVNQIETLSPILRMASHLLPHIVNGGRDRLWQWKNVELSRSCETDTDLGKWHNIA